MVLGWGEQGGQELLKKSTLMNYFSTHAFSLLARISFTNI